MRMSDTPTSIVQLAGPGSCNGSKAATAASTRNTADYLAQLLMDKKQLTAFPHVFVHIDRLLDEEISRVRANLFQIQGYLREPLELPDGQGPPVTLTDKVYVPVKDHPEFNFVGRILGPRGLTAKQLEQETGCKVMVRGKGSMRDKAKEEANRGKPNWEHLNDELHVLISVEDSENRARLKLERAIQEVKKLLTVSEGEDELKKRQLMELAIINGTYRDSASKNSSPGLDTNRLQLTANAPNAAATAPMLQAAAAAYAARVAAANAAMAASSPPFILSPRLQHHHHGAPAPLPLMSPQQQGAGGAGGQDGGPPNGQNGHPGLMYTTHQYEYLTYPGLLEYTTAMDSGHGAMIAI